ncbi:ATP-binding cassette domain-containing protein [Kitasatospora sp. NPDC089797]|uniref:peptidase domain-containing ABC transporter n=1 Tax=Kitasatospora sp. NPDC089797 TaxID=3155298 RepID=UPI00341CC403
MNYRRFHTHQSGDTDCGPACVRTVLRRHGRLVDTALLRDSVGLGLRGSNLARLRRVLAEYGVESDLLRLDAGQLARALAVAGPAIIRVHIDSRPHFVVVHAVDGTRFTVSDPLFTGPVTIDAADLAEVFTGHALVTGRPQAGSSRRERRRGPRPQPVLRPLIRSHWPALAGLLALTTTVSLVALLTSLFLKVGADLVLQEDSTRSLDLLAAVLALVVMVAAGVNHLRGRMSVRLGQSLQRRLSEDYVRRLLRLPLGFHQGRRAGDLVNRVDDIGEIQSLVASSTVRSTIDLGVALLTGGYLALDDPPVLGVLAVSAALNLCSSYLLFRPIRTAAEEALQRDATLKAELFNVLRGYEHVVALAARDFAVRRVLERLELRIAAETRLGRLGSTNTVLKSLNLGLTTLFVAWTCLHQSHAGARSVGEILATVALSGCFLAAVDSLATLQVTFQHLAAAIGRYRDVTQQREDPRLAVAPDPGRPALQGADVDVRGLSVAYPEQTAPVLRDFDLTIGPGQRIRLAGANGQGKSTALKALAGFIEDHGGTIRIGGLDLASLGDTALRERVLYLGETPLLLAASLRENLDFGRSADDRARMLACRTAGFDEVLAGLPEGLDTLVREDGSGLSRGQIQRLALARAVLRRPDVYLLDEAFSGIDRATVQRIWANLAELPAAKVVVSHTAATDLAFDHVIRLPARDSRGPRTEERSAC